MHVSAELGESAFSDIQFAKRIDSTFRGPVAAETKAMLRSLTDPVSAMVVAAYPASGRTVEDGRLLAHGVPVDQTELARDPLTPVSTAYLPNLLSRTSSLPLLRTSVDHGTAFDIAGRGVASEVSMVEAMLAAARYAWCYLKKGGVQ